MNCLQYYYDPLLLPTIPSNHTSLAWISLSLLLHGGYSWGVDLVRTYQLLGLLVITVDICKVLQHCNHCVVILALRSRPQHLSDMNLYVLKTSRKRIARRPSLSVNPFSETMPHSSTISLVQFSLYFFCPCL